MWRRWVRITQTQQVTLSLPVIARNKEISRYTLGIFVNYFSFKCANISSISHNRWTQQRLENNNCYFMSIQRNIMILDSQILSIFIYVVLFNQKINVNTIKMLK